MNLSFTKEGGGTQRIVSQDNVSNGFCNGVLNCIFETCHGKCGKSCGKVFFRYRSGTVNSKSFVGKVLLRIKQKFELTYALLFKFPPKLRIRN